jgi:hypothetical protein
MATDHTAHAAIAIHRVLRTSPHHEKAARSLAICRTPHRHSRLIPLLTTTNCAQQAENTVFIVGRKADDLVAKIPFLSRQIPCLRFSDCDE